MAVAQETINELVVASHFDFPKVQQMLAENPEILNENAEWMETPVQAAAHVGNVEIAEYLLNLGASLDICTAAMLGREADIDAILAEDAEMIHARGAHNIPLLYYPIIMGNLDLAKKLYERGADINGDDGGNVPIHGAAQRGQTEAMKWLLANDANPYAVDFEGKNALDIAEARGYTEIIELLRPFFSTEEG